MSDSTASKRPLLRMAALTGPTHVYVSRRQGQSAAVRVALKVLTTHGHVTVHGAGAATALAAAVALHVVQHALTEHGLTVTQHCFTSTQTAVDDGHTEGRALPGLHVLLQRR